MTIGVDINTEDTIVSRLASVLYLETICVVGWSGSKAINEVEMDWFLVDEGSKGLGDSDVKSAWRSALDVFYDRIIFTQYESAY